MTSRQFLAALLLWFVAGLTLAAAAPAPLVIDERQDAMALGLHTAFLRDESGTLRIEDVVARTDFQPGDVPALSFGFTQDVIWLRFDVQNPTAVPQTRILDVRYFLLNDVILYVPATGGQYEAQASGRSHPQGFRHDLSRFFAFELQLPPASTQTYYMKVTSADAIALPLFLSTPQRQQAYQVSDTLYMTLYVGMILSTIFFAVFMLLSLRERELVYYLGFLLCHHLMVLNLMEGIPSAVLGLESPFLTQELVVPFVSLAILMAVLFMRQFLRLQTANPRLYRFTHALLGMLLLSLSLFVVLPHFQAIIATTFVCMLVGSGMMLVCILQVLNGQPEARYFLLAWSAGILGASIYGMKLFQLLPVNLFTSYSWHVGTLVEAILFSFTIAHRVNRERRQRLQVQTELADRERALRLTQEQLLRAETAAKEELEVRVRERTRDITRILAELENENKTLVELSINDGLTRVRNRRFFNDVFPQLWQDGLAGQRWLSVVLLDIDHFKSVNDQHGHLMGDHCLVVVAGVLKQMVSRPGDVVCRYGGEEFALLLPETDVESARWVAERIRHRISETRCELDGTSISLTLSAGVAGMVPEPGLDPLRLLAAADSALYQSKQEGRNRVTVAGKPAAPNNVMPLNRRV